jgi:hypothetical protein
MRQGNETPPHIFPKMLPAQIHYERHNEKILKISQINQDRGLSNGLNPHFFL